MRRGFRTRFRLKRGAFCLGVFLLLISLLSLLIVLYTLRDSSSDSGFFRLPDPITGSGTGSNRSRAILRHELTKELLDPGRGQRSKALVNMFLTIMEYREELLAPSSVEEEENEDILDEQHTKELDNEISLND